MVSLGGFLIKIIVNQVCSKKLGIFNLKTEKVFFFYKEFYIIMFWITNQYLNISVVNTCVKDI